MDYLEGLHITGICYATAVESLCRLWIRLIIFVGFAYGTITLLLPETVNGGS